MIYNGSSHYTSFVGEPTTLELDDRVHCLVNADGEASFIYVVSRNYKSDIYWNVTRKYNSTTKETTRTPDADGYYRITVIHRRGYGMVGISPEMIMLTGYSDDGTWYNVKMADGTNGYIASWLCSEPY